MNQIPRIGVGVAVRKEGKILLGKRKNAHGEGTWCFPGGHLEFNETIFDCAIRETDEESGLTVANLAHGCFSEDFFEIEGKHYITHIVVCDWQAGEPELREPHKCLGWEWFAWNELPENLFIPIQNIIKQGWDPFKTK